MPDCSICGQHWPTDPRLSVHCPRCKSAPGSPCRRPSEHTCTPHVERERLAVATGALPPCPDGPQMRRLQGSGLSADEARRRIQDAERQKLPPGALEQETLEQGPTAKKEAPRKPLLKTPTPNTSAPMCSAPSPAPSQLALF